ncbi:peroxisome biogenesis protein 16 [Argentina anserina]|uniref:peroxisome biogenesis protein 16 n=1 Tax=Argentina anserina TaxID=57926 RepID=UPI0021767DD6|nr:peroxisome biogenesis protein 16 [Potentilla anserina]
MEAYKKWVRENKDYVHSLESLANGVTWLLPERFSESEIGPEAVTTVLGIISAVNEHIIDTTPQLHVGHAERNSFPYPLCISALKDLETLVEVVAQHYFGDEKKWNYIAIMEASKVLVRLALFQNSGYKMLLHGGQTPNDEKNLEVSTPQHRSSGGFVKTGGQHGNGDLRNNHAQDPWNLERRALSALNRFGEKARSISDPEWLRRVQHHHAIMEPPTPVVERLTISTILSKKGLHGALYVAGEVLFITRPLIYVLFIRKYGVRSWIPWFLSFAVDVAGMGILSRITSSTSGTEEQQFHLSVSEKNEVKRRKLLWALYLMRDPFFSKYTRGRLESTENVLEHIPVVGFLAGKLVELLSGAQTRYTYMSGS